MNTGINHKVLNVPKHYQGLLKIPASNLTAGISTTVCTHILCNALEIKKSMTAEVNGQKLDKNPALGSHKCTHRCFSPDVFGCSTSELEVIVCAHRTLRAVHTVARWGLL